MILEDNDCEFRPEILEESSSPRNSVEASVSLKSELQVVDLDIETREKQKDLRSPGNSLIRIDLSAALKPKRPKKAQSLYNSAMKAKKKQIINSNSEEGKATRRYNGYLAPK